MSLPASPLPEALAPDAVPAPAAPRAGKAAGAFRTISEVAEDLGVPQHVLRFWETKFFQIRPIKRGGGRRYYRPEDVALLKRIHHLLYGEGYTIKGVQKLLKGVSKSQMADASAAPIPAPANEGRGPAAASSRDAVLISRAILEEVLGELQALRALVQGR